MDAAEGWVDQAHPLDLPLPHLAAREAVAEACQSANYSPHPANNSPPTTSATKEPDSGLPPGGQGAACLHPKEYSPAGPCAMGPLTPLLGSVL